jgi:hypothetical protein
MSTCLGTTFKKGFMHQVEIRKESSYWTWSHSLKLGFWITLYKSQIKCVINSLVSPRKGGSGVKMMDVSNKISV